MRTILWCLGVGLALGCSPRASAQIVLAIDFNDRSTSLPTNNLAGFDPFVIGSIGSATLLQTNPTMQTFGAITVTVSGNGSNPSYDDRLRNVPGDGGAVSQAPLYRDFVFSTFTGADAGLNVTIDGLTPDQPYKVTIWSFDSSSGGTRVSDWFANGSLVRLDYTFDGRVAPTSDSQYRFNFAAMATGAGQILVQARRKPSIDTAGAQSFGVFLNALQVEIGLPDPPSIIANPQPLTLYAGDRATFSGQAAGSAPISLQWYLGEVAVDGATNNTLIVPMATAMLAGDYYLVASSPHGMSATSQVATLTVLPVTNITSGLLAHWSLDGFDPGNQFVPDLTAHANDLAPASLDASNFEAGRHGASVRFNGVDEYLSRSNNFASLPAYQYPAYTVALWVKGNGVGQSDRRVWAESSNTNNTPIADIGTVPGGTNGTVDIFIRTTSGGGGINHRQSSLIAFDGNWHHVAWVDNNGAGRVYVDGVQDTNDFTYNRGVLVADATCLGGVARTNGALSSSLFTGNVDDVHIWRRALAGNEVRTVMDRIRILNLEPGSPNFVINYATSTPADMHRVQEKAEVADPWSDTAGVVITSTGPNTFAATFPAPSGGLRLYRVISP